MRGVRYLGLPLIGWIVLMLLIATGSGVAYTISLAHSGDSTPVLPAGPPHATLLAHNSTTDMISGNFVVTTALYRSSEAPPALVAYYRHLLAAHLGQQGNFQTIGTTIQAGPSPTALQHLPPLFGADAGPDPYAARYLYTEYSANPNDVGIAIDARQPRGPTLVFLEMLTHPGE